MPKVRIGIDVGGTFTHAVALDNETYEILGQAKVLTTHKFIAQGIIEALNKLLKEASLSPSDISFIAHSTTQATNALLEGDVAKVGIVGMGKGVEGLRAKGETKVGDFHQFLDTGETNFEEKIEKAIKNLIDEGASAIVASEAFGVDDPKNEHLVIELASKERIPATAGHELTGLYGLRIRTRTSVINASILPKMIEAADMTEEAVKKAGIKAKLMIMRSDGGVMTAEEMRRRPILTILSGPAAGVAGALLYIKVSDAIFMDVGGTSTDISVIKDGRALVKSAEIGGHRLFLRTLDTRTVGLAGGSLPKVEGRKIVEVGPRSAHIAGLAYACFTPKEDLEKIPHAVTPTCATNILGLVPEGDYAYGNRESAVKALTALAQKLGKSVEEVAEEILKLSASKLIPVIEKLIHDYRLDRRDLVLIGGGGGAGAIVPYVAKLMRLDYKIAKNSELISSLGVALALVHDTVERTIVNPTDQDLIKIRAEAEERIIKMGAAPETLEISIEVDPQRNIVRASAEGALEFRKGREKIIEESALIKKAKRVIKTTQEKARETLETLIESESRYGDAGRILPNIILCFRQRTVNLSGLISPEQILALADLELRNLEAQEEVSLIVA